MSLDNKILEEIGPIWRELHGGLWHTTSPERFLGIIDAGEILPEPDIPNAERWSTSAGPKHYPYVRHIGGVSLFDFHDFNDDEYKAKYPISNWREFVPYRDQWGSAIWLEVSRELAGESLISGSDLICRWKKEECYGHRVMPMIECAYIGPLPIRLCPRAILIQRDKEDYQKLSPQEFRRAVIAEATA